MLIAEVKAHVSMAESKRNAGIATAETYAATADRSTHVACATALGVRQRSVVTTSAAAGAGCATVAAFVPMASARNHARCAQNRIV